MSPVALAFGVLEATGSAGWLSAILAAATVPMVATMILGGGIADRYRRNTVLRLTSLGSGISQTGVALVLLTHQSPVLLLPLAAFNGMFQALTTPTLRGIVPQLASGRGIRGAGALLATMVTAKLTVRRPMVPALTLMTLVGVPLILLGVRVGTVWLAAAAFAAGIAAAFFTVAWSTVWHTHIPERLSSRVGAWDEFGSFASIPIGQLTIPILATTFGAGPVAITGGTLTMIAMLLPLLLPSLRRIEIATTPTHDK